FYDHLTAEELLHCFGRLFGQPSAVRQERVPRLLDEVGLGAERRLPLRRFSKGMLQRVGLAQALLNDPEVVFLDEPMSGLDPIGRRMVRDLILQLRDRGRTVFFSSHILSDAEALCSRVAILAGGRLVSAGRLAEMLAFDVRGWELVAGGVGEATLAAVKGRCTRYTPIAEGRYTFELPAAARTEEVMSALVSSGATIVSLNPVRETLEEFFMRQVANHASAREVDL
ncbi:MAG: ABC transporter ATP-binding protein, partial [Acidobacteria bacterium]